MPTDAHGGGARLIDGVALARKVRGEVASFHKTNGTRLLGHQDHVGVRDHRDRKRKSADDELLLMLGPARLRVRHVERAHAHKKGSAE